mmetsp:Transcript_149253/g.278364  ORF Transcript_149253/g.278364 Transcript_149253/m.278364 type:complete len:1432 (-) Transcript_149253:37-4332(-)
MGSWVLHAAGLLIEELSRAQVQALGRGCRPWPHKVNAADPPPNTVSDGHGHFWEVGDRARHTDSISLADNAEKPDGFGSARSRVPGKYKLGKVSSTEGGDRMLLLPDHVEVRGHIDEPTAICASDGPPGLPINSQLNSLSAATLPRRGTIRAPVRSVEMKLAHAHHAVAQRRLRSYQSEYFCLMVPCCRVTLGPGTHDQPPAANPIQWPAYVSALVLGAHVDGEILPRGRPSMAQHTAMAAKAAAERKSKVSTAGGRADDRVKWQTESGETVLLDFHNGPVSRGPAGSDADIYNLLSYLDEHWVRKARRFPATWSLLWVETMDTEMVLAEMRGDGVEDTCPVCTAPLIFGALDDKDGGEDSSDEDSSSEDGESSSKSKSSGSRPSTPSSAAASNKTKDSDELPSRPVAETKAQTQRRATRAVQKLLRASTMSLNMSNNVSRPPGAPADWKEGHRASNCSAQSDEINRNSIAHNISRVSTNLGEQSQELRGFGSMQQGVAMQPRDTQGQAATTVEASADSPVPPRLTESFLAARVMEISDGDLTRPSRIMEGDSPHGDIAAWETGSLPCARCHTTSEPPCHALICPRLDARHSYFLPMCAECREAVEHVFQKRRWHAGQSSNTEDLLRRETSGSTPAASGAINSHAVLTSTRELCVAIELEMHLGIEDVDQSRHGNLLDELRDEIHRVLMVPLRQIFVLQDDSSRKGIFQVGILHPELVPTAEERRLMEQQKNKKKNWKAASSPPKPGSPASPTSQLSFASQDIAGRRTEAASIATELGKMWDRLVTIYYGDSGEYRFGSTNAFPLLRLKRRDGSGLTWRSGVVLSTAARKDLIQTMHDSKEAGSDDEGSVEDSDMDDLYAMDQDSTTNKPEARRPSAMGVRRTSNSAAGEVTSATARRPSCGRFMKSVALDGLAVSTSFSDPATATGSSSPQTARSGTSNAARGVQKALELDSREVESQLRPAGLQLRSFAAFQDVRTKAENAKAEQSQQPQVEREWAREAEKLGLLPPKSELKQMHMPFVHHLAWDGNMGRLKLVLQTASSKALNAGDRCGRTPLHLAVARCKVEVVGLFISAAEPLGLVKLEQKDIKGRTPLHYSAYRGDNSIVSCFVRVLQIKSLDIMEFSTGDTAVLIAARSQHEDALKSLLFAFASPNIANQRGLTPLHVAAAAGAAHCCELLLRAGAEVEPKDALDRTPWQWAAIYKYSDVMDLLVNAGSTSTQDPWDHPAKAKPLSSLPLGRVKARNSHWSRSSTRGSHKPATAPEMPKGRRPRPGTLLGTGSTEVITLPTVPNTPRTPRAQTAPASPAKAGLKATPAHGARRNSLRDALLEGVGPQDQVMATAPGGWAGNVGSLAVRWRTWAHAAFGPADCSAMALLPVMSSRSELESAEPTREEVAKTCMSLGGFFCTVCWEYVLDGHPHGHLMCEGTSREF